jgi:predicted AAA+ superfamily ATPase
VSRDPLRGGLYENLLILEILKSRLNYGKRPELFFYRDTNSNEVDLVIKKGRTLLPVEIKSAVTFTPDFLKGIERFRKIAGDRCSKGYVLYNGHDEYTLKGTRVFNPLAHEGLEARLR